MTCIGYMIKYLLVMCREVVHNSLETFIHSSPCLSFVGPLLVLAASSEPEDSLSSDDSGLVFSCSGSIVFPVTGVCFSLIAGRVGLCK